MIDTIPTSSKHQEVKHVTELLNQNFKIKKGASRQQIQAKIKDLERYIQSLNGLFNTPLVEDDKELEFLMEVISQLISQKEAYQWMLMSEEEKKLRRQAAEHFQRKAQSAVGGMRILEPEK